MNNPCRYCTQRTIECHGTCRLYKTWRKHIIKLNNERKKLEYYERLQYNKKRREK